VVSRVQFRLITGPAWLVVHVQLAATAIERAIAVPSYLNVRRDLLKIAIGARKRSEVGAFTGPEQRTKGLGMRTSVLAMIVVAGSAIAFQATAQQQQAAPSEQTREQIHSDVDKGLKTSEPDEQMRREADKGAKTRNSGESGYVADQDKPGASAHPPGQPESKQTTGSTSQTGAPK
jgi:hypothetical protein